jgi:hypothetical protein
MEIIRPRCSEDVFELLIQNNNSIYSGVTDDKNRIMRRKNTPCG